MKKIIAFTVCVLLVFSCADVAFMGSADAQIAEPAAEEAPILEDPAPPEEPVPPGESPEAPTPSPDITTEPEPMPEAETEPVPDDTPAPADEPPQTEQPQEEDTTEEPAAAAQSEVGAIALAPLPRAGTNSVEPTTYDPDAAFDRFQLEVLGEVKNNQVELRFLIGLNDSYIRSTMDNAIANGVLAQEPDQSSADYDAYLNGLNTSLLPNIEFTCIFDENDVVLPPGVTPGTAYDILDSEGNVIGEYKWAVHNGKLAFAGKFDNCIYNRVRAAAQLTFKLDCAQEQADGTTAGLTYNDDTDMVDITFTPPPASATDPAGNYGIKKDTLNAVDGKISGTTVEYIVELSAENGGKLNGKWFEDVMDSQLIIEDATITIDGTEHSLNDAISADKTTLKFELDDGADLTAATVYIRAGLTPDAMETYMGGTLLHFENVAKLLREEDDQDDMPTSNPVETDMTQNYFSKSGSVNPENTRYFDWWINVNSSGTAVDNAYIIDHVDSAVHRYVTDEDVQVTIDGVTTTLPIVPLSLPANTTFGNLDSDALKNDSPEFQTIQSTLGNNTCGVFTNAGGDMILVIPFMPYVGKDVTFQYTTEMNKDIDPTAEGRPPTIENEAKLVYENMSYHGVGMPDDFDFDINEGFDPIYDWVTKSAGSYDKDTQTMTWNFAVNRYRTEMNALTVTDELFTDAQKFLLWDTHADLVLGGSETRTVRYFAPGSEPASGDYYTLTDNSPTYESVTFKLYLDGVTDEQYYTFSLQTKVVDTTILSKNTTIGQLVNNADATAHFTTGDKTQDRTEATKTIDNTLLEKTNELDGEPSKYDYTENTHTVGWTVTVNPHHVPIDAGAVLTDTLPTGTNIFDITKVTRTSATGTVTQGTVDFGAVNTATITFGDGLVLNVGFTHATDGDGFSTDTMAISFPDAFSDTFEFQFLTELEEKYRKDMFDSAGSPYGFAPIDLHNEASLSGTVYGESITATAEANNKAPLPPIVKTGQYVAGGSTETYIDWQIVVNRHSAPLQGWIVEDDFSNKPYYQFDPDSFHIYQGLMAADGTLASYSGSDLRDYMNGLAVLDVQEDSFSFRIPVESPYNAVPLVIVFRTYLVDDANADQMVNNVRFENPAGGTMDTGDQEADDAGDFRVDDFTHASKCPLVYIQKYSSNRNGIDYNPPLKGAEFTLTAVDETDTPIPGAEAYSSAKTTNDKGAAIFILLDKDTYYRLEETDVPDGYGEPGEVGNNTRYVYFKEHADPSVTAIGGVKVDVIDTKDETLATHGMTYTLTNTPYTTDSPNGGVVEFTKQTNDTPARLLSGVEFRLALNGTTFALTEKSGTDGKVRFDKLDEGTYTLTEVRGYDAAQYVKPQAWTVKIDLVESPSGDLLYETTITGGNTGSVTGPVNASYTITNDYIRAAAQLKKVDGGQHSSHVSGAEFTVYLKDTTTAVAYLVGSTAGTYALSPTAVNGIAQPDLTGKVNAENRPYLQQADTSSPYKLIYGDYYFSETHTPPGYEEDCDSNDDLHKYPFKVSSDSDIHLTKNTTNAIGSNGSLFTNVCSAAEVFINKRDKYSTDAPVHGAVFTVYSNVAQSDPGNGVAVAFLVEDGNTGKYHLSNTHGSTTLNEVRDSDGTPFLHMHGTKFVLLYEDYYFEETTTPAGYLPDYESGTTDFVKHHFDLGFGAKKTYYLSDGGVPNADVDNAASDSASTYFYNSSALGSVVLNKYDDDYPTQTVSGAEFTVYLNGTTTAVAYLVEDGATGIYKLSNVKTDGTGALNAANGDGRAYLQGADKDKLVTGTYYATETTTPSGYLEDKASGALKKHEFTINADGQVLYLKNDGVDSTSTNKFINTYISADVQLKKVDKDEPAITLDDAEFTVYLKDTTTPVAYLVHTAAGVYNLSNTKGDGTGALNAKNSDGRAYLTPLTDKLIGGSYYFVETKLSDNSIPDATGTDATKTQHPFTISTDGTLYLKNGGGDGTAANVFTNEFIRGTVKIDKRNSLEPDVVARGAEFTVYIDGTTTPVAYLVEQKDANGRGTGIYLLSDTDALNNTLSETIPGSKNRKYIVKDADGTFRLALGEYFLVETTPAAGYEIDAPGGNAGGNALRTHKFEITEKGTVIVSNQDPAGELKDVFTNVPFTTALRLQKRDAGSAKGEGLVHGAEFTIYIDEGHPNANASDPDKSDIGKSVGFLIEDGNTGNYIVSLTDSNGDDPDIKIGKDGKYGFVYDDRLTFGNYYIEETTAPTGYLPDESAPATPNRYTVEIDALHTTYLNNDADTLGDTSHNKATYFTNEAKLMDVQLLKTDALYNWAVSGAEFTVYDAATDAAVAYLAEDGTTAGTYKLSNVKTDGTGALDAKDADGRVVLQNGKLVYGSYYVKETTTPDGYIADDTEHPFTIDDTTYDDTDPIVIINDSVNNTFTNTFITARLTINKADAVSNAAKVYGAEFSIFDTDDTSTDPQPIAFLKETGTSTGVYTLQPSSPASNKTDAAGNARPYLWQASGTDPWELIAGDYYFTESTTPDGYKPDYADGTTELIRHAFTIDDTGSYYFSNTEMTEEGTALFENTSDNTEIRLLKRDEDVNTVGIAGAEFTVYAADSTEASGYRPIAFLIGKSTGEYKLSVTNTGGSADLSGETDANGRLYVQNGALVYGDYFYSETTTPTGYNPDYTAGTTNLALHTFTIDDAAAAGLVYLTNSGQGADDSALFTNKIIQAGVSLTKVDSDDNSMNVSGAEFTIYEKGTGKAVAYLVESGAARYVLSDTNGAGATLAAKNTNGMPYIVNGKLIYGDYYLSETTTPEGYRADTDAAGSLRRHDFSVGTNEDVVLSNAAGGVFTNLYKRADVLLNKGDADRPALKVDGAEFTVYERTGQRPVAYLVGKGNGSYVLSNVNSKGRLPLNATDLKTGRPYLLDNKLSFGQYYFVENITPDEYQPNYAAGTTTLARNQFDVTDEGTFYLGSSGASANASTVFANKPVTYSISGYVQDTDGNRLSGALVGVFPKGTTKFTADNAIPGMITTTGPNGEFRFDGLYAGEYVIMQIEPPGGYSTTDKLAVPYHVTVNSSSTYEELNNIVFTDFKPPEPEEEPQPTATAAPVEDAETDKDAGKGAKTGDDTPISAYLWLLLGAGILLAGVLGVRRRQKQ